jgi:hypothetical protein
MIRPWRSIALLVALLTLAGCATGSSSGQSGSSPRVRCLSDPGRDAAATSRPLFFLFCVESP